MSKTYNGTVKSFNAKRGFGFITSPEVQTGNKKKPDFFFHYSQIVMDGFKKLNDGAPVTFTVAETDKGMEAREVTPVHGK